MKGYLLVRADGKTYGLPVAHVLEVGDATEILHVPRTLPAMRGLTPLRGRLVPLIHLGAFLTGSDPSPAAAPGASTSAVRTVVLVELGAGGRQVAFEVDDADAVVREQPLPVPRGQTLPWASGVAEQAGGVVPILDLDALGDRIT
jgi:chemotaxis signal transduction protein